MKISDIILQLASIIGGLGVISSILIKGFKKIIKPIEEMQSNIESLKEIVTANGKVCGLLLKAEIKTAYERLMKKGKCTLMEKRNFLILCANYRKMGYNHIRALVEEDIVNLPIVFAENESAIDGDLSPEEKSEYKYLERLEEEEKRQHKHK